MKQLLVHGRHPQAGVFCTPTTQIHGKSTIKQWETQTSHLIGYVVVIPDIVLICSSKDIPTPSRTGTLLIRICCRI